MKRDDLVYIEHINSALEKITDYINDHNLESFLKSNQTQDAVIRQLEIIGEATKHISKQLRDRNLEIPWSDMAGMRDKLIHDYIDVDLWIVWETATNDVAYLKKLLKNMEL